MPLHIPDNGVAIQNLADGHVAESLKRHKSISDGCCYQKWANKN